MESSAIKGFLDLMPKPLTKCARVSWQFHFVKSFLLENHFSYSKLTFLTRNSLFLLETHFSYSKLAFLTRNSLFLLETRFSYSKLTFLTRNSLFLLETHFSREHFIWQLVSHDGYPKRCYTCHWQIFKILASVCS